MSRQRADSGIGVDAAWTLNETPQSVRSSGSVGDAFLNGLGSFVGSFVSDHDISPKEPPKEEVAVIMLTIVQGKNFVKDNNKDMIEVKTGGEIRKKRLLQSPTQQKYKLHPYTVVTINDRHKAIIIIKKKSTHC